MAYVEVPRDLSKFESKIALNLTKRQLICFGSGIILGLPTYFFIKSFEIPIDICTTISFVIMSPFFMCGVYKKDGIPLEKYIYMVIKQKYLRPHIRKYKTNNIFSNLIEVGKKNESISKKTKKKITKNNK